MWIFQGQEVIDPPEKAFGFIYLMIHLESGRKYLGRKQLWFSKFKTVKGKKKRIKVPSDWKDYYSSSPEVLGVVAEQGTNSFSREILMYCASKSELMYSEENLLHITNALTDPNWFNSNIRSRMFSKWFKDPKFIETLAETRTKLTSL